MRSVKGGAFRADDSDRRNLAKKNLERAESALYAETRRASTGCSLQKLTEELQATGAGTISRRRR
jgi:hypothetical protein